MWILYKEFSSTIFFLFFLRSMPTSKGPSLPSSSRNSMTIHDHGDAKHLFLESCSGSDRLSDRNLLLPSPPAEKSQQQHMDVALCPMPTSRPRRRLTKWCIKGRGTKLCQRPYTGTIHNTDLATHTETKKWEKKDSTVYVKIYSFLKPGINIVGGL